jgi:hypothetical protein
MLSESARMSSAAEARFRIDAPNSLPRATKVIALDRASEGVVKALAQSPWNNTTFFTASALAGAPRKDQPFSMQGWLSDLAGRTKNLLDEINTADLVVMVASVIGEACSLKRVMTTALILGSAVKSDEVLAKSLAAVRPYARMLVISSAEEYIFDMLTALRA